MHLAVLLRAYWKQRKITLAEVINTTENGIELFLNYQEASLVKLLLGKFAQGNAGPLLGIWQQLEEYVGDIENIAILSQSDPLLYLAAKEEK